MLPTYEEIIVRLLLSLFWGGLIGLERQYHHKPAGFRTMIMISIGSCLFSFLSGLLGGPENVNRIAANVVTGIGFLGAGVIFRSVNRVNGITTAAAIWSVAAVGMSIGSGYYVMASIASLFILSVLAVLPYVEQKMDNYHCFREYYIIFEQHGEKKEYCQELLRLNHLKFRIIRESWSADLSITLEVWGKPEDHIRFVEALTKSDSFKKVDYSI